MDRQQLDTPVAFFVFNRPDVTARVFAAIATARPKTLFVVCDGPRPDRLGEAETVEQVRSIVSKVEWECEVHRNYSPVNLGTKARVSSGLTWVFAHVERAIILEDDCLPSPAFFDYCSRMLAQYQDVRRVFAVSGSNFSRRVEPPGHYFSNYPLMWGWATWRDRWMQYELEPRDAVAVLRRMWWRRPVAFAYWARVFYALIHDPIDTWDYQWILTMWRNRALACRPTVNLVQNIGFGQHATHTRNAESRLAGIAASDQDCTRCVSPLAADPRRDAIDEHEWAFVGMKSVLLMYFPWLRRFARTKVA